MIKILKYIFTVILVLFIFSCTLSRGAYTKKQRTKEGIVYYYYNNGQLKETRNTKDGIRHGITEIIHRNDEECTRQISVYKYGILQEIGFYSMDGVLIDNYIYSGNGGDLIESNHLHEIDTASNLHYVRKVSIFPCRYMQYHIINNTIVDSMVVQIDLP
jgi:hypothetical protein